MKNKNVPRKLLSSKMLHLKMKCVSEHGTMMYNHMNSDFMRARAKEEILMNGDVLLACSLMLLAEIKDESTKPKE
jgi:hypothetical protein